MCLQIPADGAVEKWMVKVEEEMHHTLHVLSKEAVFYYPTKARVEWIQEQLGMVAIAGTQIWWTWEVRDNAIHRWWTWEVRNTGRPCGYARQAARHGLERRH